LIRPSGTSPISVGCGCAQTLVAVERRVLDTEHLQVPVEHGVDGRAGARVALLIDLRRQARARLLGFLRRPRTGRDDLRQVASFARDGVDPVVHADTQRAARQGLDLTRERFDGATVERVWLPVQPYELRR